MPEEMKDFGRDAHYYEDLSDQVGVYLTNSAFDQYQRNYFPIDRALRAGYKSENVNLFYDDYSDANMGSDAYTTIKISNEDFNKAYAVVAAFNKALLDSDRAEQIKTKEADGNLYIYVPFDAYPEYRMVEPRQRKRAIYDFNYCIEDFIRVFARDINAAEWKSLSYEEKDARVRNAVKEAFPTATKKDIDYARDLMAEEEEFMESYKQKGDKKVYTLEEAFKELNRKPEKVKKINRPVKRIVEAKEKEEKVCEKCGKNPCACKDESLNEDITSDEIKDFIAKVGIEALEKAIADVKGEAPAEELPVEAPVEDIAVEEIPAEEEEVKEALNEENADEGLIGDVANVVAAPIKAVGNLVSNIGEGFDEEELNESIEEFADQLPVHFLSESEITNFANDYPVPTPGRPPRFFKLGYARQIVKEEAAQFRADRSERTANRFPDAPIVDIIKCTEYSALYAKNPWLNTDATRKADKILGAERHTGEKTGFQYGENDVVNMIGTYPDGSKALQAYIADHSRQRVRWFISVNGEELRPAERDEIAQYLTPAEASKVLNGAERKPAGFDAEGNAVHDKPINRFKFNGIYMLGNLGGSIL